MQIYDSTGKVIADTDGITAPKPPKVGSGSFYRLAHMKGSLAHKDEIAGVLVREHTVTRAQVPWVVTLLNYDSELQLKAHETEFYVYAPPKQSVAVKLAFELWRHWWKDAPVGRPMSAEQSIMFPEWPKVGEGAVAERIDDETFMELWKFAQRKGESKRKITSGIVRFTPGYLAAGHPEDPFAFTDTSGSVRLYRTGDFQNGMDIRI